MLSTSVYFQLSKSTVYCLLSLNYEFNDAKTISKVITTCMICVCVHRACGAHDHRKPGESNNKYW